jgi:hypothetical protein
MVLFLMQSRNNLKRLAIFSKEPLVFTVFVSAAFRQDPLPAFACPRYVAHA